jgi:hypothetical protein
MQIGQGGSLPGASGFQNVRPDAAPRPDSSRAQALEAARAALKRVAPPVAADAEPAKAQPQAEPRRNLPRGTLVNITA